MELENELDDFLVSKDRMFLIRGAWGVGKTTAVESWLGSNSLLKSGWKIIRLSLFGVSDANELYTRLIRQSSLLGTIARRSNKLRAEISAEYFAGGSFSLAGLFDLLAESYFEQQRKKNRWNRDKKITKYLIVVDDIERKDNRLSLDEVFGFIDHLGSKNSKVIAITNSSCFQGDPEFFHFKEKVFDRDYFLEKPTLALKKLLFDNHLLFDKLKLSEIDNLRTLKRIKNAVELSAIKDDSIGYYRLLAMVKAINAVDNCLTAPENVKTRALDGMERKAKLFERPTPFDLEKAEKEYLEKHRTYTNAHYFAEYYGDESVFGCIMNLENFLAETYRLVEGNKYELIKDIQLSFSSSPYPIVNLHLDLNEFTSGNNESISGKIDELENILKNEFNELCLFYELCRLATYIDQAPHNENIESRLSDVSDKAISILSSRLIDSEYWWGGDLDSYHLAHNTGTDPKVIDRYSNLLKAKVIDLFLNTFNRIDVFSSAAIRDRAREILHFTDFEPSKYHDRFVKLVESIVCSYVEKSAEHISPYDYIAFDFMREFKNDYKTICEIIDKVISDGIPKKVEDKLLRIKRDYYS